MYFYWLIYDCSAGLFSADLVGTAPLGRLSYHKGHTDGYQGAVRGLRSTDYTSYRNRQHAVLTRYSKRKRDHCI